MKHTSIFIFSSLVSFSAHAQLTVHEWGTFTSLVGSNGQAQNGMYHEDEKLPEFVHNFGENSGLPPGEIWCGKVPCQYLGKQKVTQKMETPVAYFYSDKSQRVSFSVTFPNGIISQSFPEASFLLPQSHPEIEFKNGFARYDLTVLKNSAALPPSVESTNIYFHARNVASDLIQIGSETEKFIFYRGLGDFETQLFVTSEQGQVFLENKGKDDIPAIFLVKIDEKQNGNILPLGPLLQSRKLILTEAQIQTLNNNLQAQPQFLRTARESLLVELNKAGLYQDEARAMINTWENGYFKTSGLRVLYILGNQEVEDILPVQITPVPDSLKRVFVGRIEVLLDTEEENILMQIMQQKSKFDINHLGRVAHPTLLRIKELAQSKGLLTAEFGEALNTLIQKSSK